ncbi:unnamed protein product [Merluccius merluccius]
MMSSPICRAPRGGDTFNLPPVGRHGNPPRQPCRALRCPGYMCLGKGPNLQSDLVLYVHMDLSTSESGTQSVLVLHVV